MKKFINQTLSKSQMNKVTGGKQFIRCAIVNSKDEMVSTIIASGDTIQEATIALAQGIPAGHNAVDCVSYEA